MTQARHTPGPWHFDGAGLIYCEHPKLGKMTVAQCELAPVELSVHNSRVGRLQSNARLIAMAPALLAAAEEVLRTCSYEKPPHADAIDELRAAIAKARGE